MDNNKFDNIEYDINGNLYILNKSLDEIYMVCIDSTDNIFLELIKNKIYDDHTKEKEIKKTPKENQLHMNTIKEALNEIDTNNLEDYDENQLQEISDTYNEFVHNPEYKYYNQDNPENNSDDDSNDDLDDIENKFNFYNVSFNNINKSKLIYEPPYYEFLILNGTPLNSQLVFRSQLMNNQSFYRISLYSNGHIELNVIGTKILSYTINSDTLEINKNITTFVNTFSN